MNINIKEGEQKSKSFYKKWWVWVVVVLVIIPIAWYLTGYFSWWQASSQQQAENEALREYYGAIVDEQTRLEEAYKNDFDGGKNPQETWAMFVKALKAGDTEKASKYFIIEKQEEVAREFAIGKKNGVIPYFLDDFKKVIGSDMYPDGKTFEFYTDDIDNGPGFVYVLVLNKYTNIWKIESL